MFDGEEGGRAAGGNADLRVDVLDVMVRGFRCDHQPVCDLPGAEPQGQQPEYLDLAGGETGGQWRSGGPTVACRGQDPFDGLGVQPARTSMARSSAAASSGARAPRWGRSDVMAW